MVVGQVSLVQPKKAAAEVAAEWFAILDAPGISAGPVVVGLQMSAKYVEIARAGDSDKEKERRRDR